MFKFVNTYSIVKLLHHSYCLSILPIKNKTLNITIFYKKKNIYIYIYIEILEKTNNKMHHT